MVLRRVRGTVDADTLVGDLDAIKDIYGSAVSERIFGGVFGDVLVGESDGKFANGFSVGRNAFVWQLHDEVDDGSTAGFDHITDFGAGDRLDLSRLFASAHPEAGMLISLDADGSKSACI